jgi:hypothetical protein
MTQSDSAQKWAEEGFAEEGNHIYIVSTTSWGQAPKRRPGLGDEEPSK